MPDAVSAGAGQPADHLGGRSLGVEYTFIALILGSTIAALVAITQSPPAFGADPAPLLRPVFALAGLTALVWLGMALVRNGSVARGLANIRYYESYREEAPPDWVERPARTFNNLMQIPTLFYVACLLMVALRQIDPAQVAIAWLFVALRTAHAAVYIFWNRVSIRFATYAAGCIVLAVMWARLAASAL